MFPVPFLEQPESYGIVAISVPKLQPDGVDLVPLSLPDVPLTPAVASLARCLRDACGVTAWCRLDRRSKGSFYPYLDAKLACSPCVVYIVSYCFNSTSGLAR